MSSDIALVGTQVRYEQKSYWRNPLAAVFTFAFPLVLFIILVATAGNGHDKKDLGTNALLKQYYTPSVLAYGIMSACFLNLALNMTRQRESGILKRMRGTPLPAWAFVGGVIGSAVIVALGLSTVCIIFASIVYNVSLPGAHIAPLIVTILLASIAFCALGIAASTFIPNADSGPPLVNVPYFVMVFISGTWFPVTGGLAKVAAYLPLRPFTLAMYRAYNPLTAHSSGWAWHNLGSLVIWGAIGIFVAVKRFQWSPKNRT